MAPPSASTRARVPLSERWARTETAAEQGTGTPEHFAFRFAAAAQQISTGVTISTDANLDLRVIRNAATRAADASATGHAGKIPVADGLDDPRLRDLAETVRRFMAASKAAEIGGAATARLARVLLGVAAKNATQGELVACASLEGLRARLRGEVRPETALPRPLVALLDQATVAWRTTSDADFWQAMAATAARPPGMSPERHLREQAAWLGIVAELGKADIGPRWAWATAAEKADLVDTLITAGTGATQPVRAVMDRLRTLTRGPDQLPRAIAAELAQMALAALAGVTEAPRPDRRGAVMIKERPLPPDATAQEVAEHQAREALRRTAHTLVAFDDDHPDLLAARLFRAKLSTLYVDMREQLRQYTPRSDAPDDLPGEERHRRFLAALGPLDRAVIEALDRWSAAIATGSTDARRYVDVAREARDAIEAVISRVGRATRPGAPGRLFFAGTGPEQTRVVTAVRMAAIELGLEAGEVLLREVAPPGDPMAGLRYRLAEMREDQKRLEAERNARMRGPLLATIALRPKHLSALNGPTTKALTTTAAAFDAAAVAGRPDPVALEKAADDLIRAVQQARTAAAALRESDRQEVVQLADLLQEIVAVHLQEWPGTLATRAAALRATIPTLPLPATGARLDRFWSEQKAEGLAMLPPKIAEEISAAMSHGLGTQLVELTARAESGDHAALEERAWTVIRILRAYKATASRLPVSRADAKARLHAALDAVALSVQRLLPPPSGADG